MHIARKGDHVVTRITGENENGETFIRSSAGPVEFTIGEGRMIQGLEEAVVGMKPGDFKTVRVTPERAFGPRFHDMTIEVDRNELPQNLDPRAGVELEMQKDGGARKRVEIVDVRDDRVVIDVNHPLAGQALTLKIKLLDIDTE